VGNCRHLGRCPLGHQPSGSFTGRPSIGQGTGSALATSVVRAVGGGQRQDVVEERVHLLVQTPRVGLLAQLFECLLAFNWQPIGLPETVERRAG